MESGEGRMERGNISGCLGLWESIVEAEDVFDVIVTADPDADTEALGIYLDDLWDEFERVCQCGGSRWRFCAVCGKPILVNVRVDDLGEPVVCDACGRELEERFDFWAIGVTEAGRVVDWSDGQLVG